MPPFQKQQWKVVHICKSFTRKGAWTWNCQVTEGEHLKFWPILLICFQRQCLFLFLSLSNTLLVIVHRCQVGSMSRTDELERQYRPGVTSQTLHSDLNSTPHNLCDLGQLNRLWFGFRKGKVGIWIVPNSQVAVTTNELMYINHWNRCLVSRKPFSVILWHH